MKSNKINMLLVIVLFVTIISITLNVTFLNKINNLETIQTEVPKSNPLTDLPPKIKSIEFLGMDNISIMKDNWATVPPDGKVKIKVIFEGNATLMDIFLTPTGSETYLLQKLVASVEVPNGQEVVEYILDVPNGTMAHLNIIAYNNMVGRKSELYNIYFE